MKVKAKHAKWGSLAVILLIIFLAYRAYAPDSPGNFEYENIATEKPVFGNADSSVLVLEYGDLQCPACRAAHPVITQIKSEFENDVAFQFVHFPLRQIHPRAQKASEAAECANDQGKFFEYIDVVFANQERLGDSSLVGYAAQLGMDTDRFEACLKSGAKQAVVERDYQQGIDGGVSSTPTFMVNGQVLRDWNVQNFRRVILDELGV